jgi:redox-sensitive bicupin YhaK (pirin superfamily)
VRVVAGKLLGATSPVATLSDTFFADASLAAGTSLPLDADYEERAIYIVSGEIEISGDRFAEGRLLVFKPGDRITVTAVRDARIVLLGGAVADGPRHIWWNFVSSRKERIEQAKADWKAGRFARVAGETEFIPLPE